MTFRKLPKQDLRKPSTWRRELAVEMVKRATRKISRCEANARRGTGTGMCDALLNEHGECPRASEHIS
jgi:hypothetical protein